VANVNVWIILRRTAGNAVRNHLNWNEDADGPYTGPVTERESRIFRSMSDHGVVQNLFKTPTILSSPMQLWSVNFDESKQTLRELKDEIDWLTATRGAQVAIAGCWSSKDGSQLGTELTYDTRTVVKTWSAHNPDYQPDLLEPDFDDRLVIRITGDVEEDYITGYTGIPDYPINTTQLLKFMPDVWNGDDPATFSPATVLSDVNLSSGQAPRDFTP
jgi:hypothetical protein